MISMGGRAPRWELGDLSLKYSRQLIDVMRFSMKCSLMIAFKCLALSTLYCNIPSNSTWP